MKTIFKEGDRVFDICYGCGEVDSIDLNDNYPINMEFDSGQERTYTLEGRVGNNIKSPTLSFTEYTLEGFSQERPATFEKDEAVAVSDGGESWSIRYYSHDNECFDAGLTSERTSDTTQWDYIKKLTDFNN